MTNAIELKSLFAKLRWVRQTRTAVKKFIASAKD